MTWPPKVTAAQIGDNVTTELGHSLRLVLMISSTFKPMYYLLEVRHKGSQEWVPMLTIHLDDIAPFLNMFTTTIKPLHGKE